MERQPLPADVINRIQDVLRKHVENQIHSAVLKERDQITNLKSALKRKKYEETLFENWFTILEDGFSKNLQLSPRNEMFLPYTAGQIPDIIKIIDASNPTGPPTDNFGHGESLGSHLNSLGPHLTTNEGAGSSNNTIRPEKVIGSTNAASKNHDALSNNKIGKQDAKNASIPKGQNLGGSRKGRKETKPVCKSSRPQAARKVTKATKRSQVIPDNVNADDVPPNRGKETKPVCKSSRPQAARKVTKATKRSQVIPDNVNADDVPPNRGKETCSETPEGCFDCESDGFINDELPRKEGQQDLRNKKGSTNLMRRLEIQENRSPEFDEHIVPFIDPAIVLLNDYMLASIAGHHIEGMLRKIKVMPVTALEVWRYPWLGPKVLVDPRPAPKKQGSPTKRTWTDGPPTIPENNGSINDLPEKDSQQDLWTEEGYDRESDGSINDLPEKDSQQDLGTEEGYDRESDGSINDLSEKDSQQDSWIEEAFDDDPQSNDGAEYLGWEHHGIKLKKGMTEKSLRFHGAWQWLSAQQCCCIIFNYADFKIIDGREETIEAGVAIAESSDMYRVMPPMVWNLTSTANVKVGDIVMMVSNYETKGGNLKRKCWSESGNAHMFVVQTMCHISGSYRMYDLPSEVQKITQEMKTALLLRAHGCA